MAAPSGGWHAMMSLTTMLFLGAQIELAGALRVQRVVTHVPAQCECALQLPRALAATQLLRGRTQQTPAAPAAAPAAPPALMPPPMMPVAAPAAAPAMALPPPPPGCDCAGGGSSTEKAGKELQEAGADGINEVNAVADDAANEEIDQLKRVGADATEKKAQDALHTMQEEEMGDVKAKLEAEEENAKQAMKEAQDNAKTSALKNAEGVTQAAEDLATTKAQNVIGTVMGKAKEEWQVTLDGAEQLKAEAQAIVQQAKTSADHALDAAATAHAAQISMPLSRVKKVTNYAVEAEKQALAMEDAAMQSKKMAEMATDVSNQAKQIATTSVSTAKAAEQTAEKAYAQAMENADKLGQLKEKANKAIEAAQQAATQAGVAESTAVTAQMAAKQAASVGQAPGGKKEE